MPCENFVKMGFEGTCPIQPGEYKQKIFIPVPDFKVPMFLTAVSKIFISLFILFFGIAIFDKTSLIRLKIIMKY